jgi:hypothetical protein
MVSIWVTRLTRVGALMTVAAAAHAVDPLPEAMSGSLMFHGAGGYSFSLSLRVEKVQPDGAVEGKLTRSGQRCGAKDEPFNGTYDGTTLKFESLPRANVNTRVSGGTCNGTDAYVLKRSADGRAFEGLMTSNYGTFGVHVAP